MSTQSFPAGGEFSGRQVGLPAVPAESLGLTQQETLRAAVAHVVFSIENHFVADAEQGSDDPTLGLVDWRYPNPPPSIVPPKGEHSLQTSGHIQAFLRLGHPSSGALTLVTYDQFPVANYMQHKYTVADLSIGVPGYRQRTYGAGQVVEINPATHTVVGARSRIGRATVDSNTHIEPANIMDLGNCIAGSIRLPAQVFGAAQHPRITSVDGVKTVINGYLASAQ